jgi:hypothetical protein
MTTRKKSFGPYGSYELSDLMGNMNEAQVSAFVDECIQQAVRRPRPKPTTDQEEIRELSLLKDEDFQRDLASLVRDLVACDKTAIPQIVAFCFRQDREVPGYIKDLFADACWSIEHYEVRSWDVLFGSHLKKGAQLTAARRRRRLGFKVWHEVQRRRAAGEPISKDMFDAIAEGLEEVWGEKVGGTLASEAYREFKKRFKGFAK